MHGEIQTSACVNSDQSYLYSLNSRIFLCCRIVHSHVKKTGKRLYYKNEDLDNAVNVVNKGMSQRQSAKQYGIPKTSLQHRLSGCYKEVGYTRRKTALLLEEEQAIAYNVATLGDFGFAFDFTRLRLLVKNT